MAMMSMQVPDVFEALCTEAALKVQDFNAQPRQHALGHGQDGHADACCLRGSLQGSGPEEQVQVFQAQALANTLWAMAMTCTQMPDVSETPFTEVAQAV